MLKGMGKGVGGVFLKPPAGMRIFLLILYWPRQLFSNLFVGLWGLMGYPLSGLRRKLLDSLGKSQEGQIVLSRIAQGHEEMKSSTADERAEVARKWILIEENLQESRRSSRRYCPRN